MVGLRTLLVPIIVGLFIASTVPASGLNPNLPHVNEANCSATEGNASASVGALAHPGQEVTVRVKVTVTNFLGSESATDSDSSTGGWASASASMGRIVGSSQATAWINGEEACKETHSSLCRPCMEGLDE